MSNTEHLQSLVERVEKYLDHHLPEPSSLCNLNEAIRYSVLNGGKRIRAILIYLIGDALGTPLDVLDIPAAAVELIHAYSLVHDDLPAMDDDDLRRGVPTTHKAFDEATAILVGDALQAIAIESLASDPAPISSDDKLKRIACLTKACGTKGLVGGQALDLANDQVHTDLAFTELVHTQKTQALITSCGELAYYSSNQQDEKLLQLIRSFTDKIGLAFQIQDDILDVTSSSEVLGKPQGSDIKHGKKTFVELLGLEPAKQRVHQLHDQAQSLLEQLSAPERLIQFSHYLLNRTF